MRLLALDPSTTSMGYAHADGSGVLRAWKHDDRPVRFGVMRRNLVWMVDNNAVDTVIYYRPFARGADATRCGWGIAGIIEATAAQAGAAVMDIAEGTVRKFFNFPKKADRAILKAFALELTGAATDDEADAILLYRYTLENVKR